MIQVFPALIHKEKLGYKVSLVDFPGCSATDVFFDKAQLLAEAMLQKHVDSMIAKGETIPQPSSLVKLSEMVNTTKASFITLLGAEMPEKYW